MESSQQQEGAGLEHLTSHPPASPVPNFHEANFIAFPNQWQSNVYGLCTVKINGCNKLLIATLRGQIFCLEFYKTPLRPPLFNPINFSYIPGKQEVMELNGVSQINFQEMKKRYDSLGRFAYKLANYHITIRILKFPR